MAADLKLSQLPMATALTGVETMAGLQTGDDVQISVAQMLAKVFSTAELLSVFGFAMPTWFGADPTGVNDCTPAFVAALAASNSIIFPPGTFQFNSAQTITLANAAASLSIRGAGKDVTVLRFSDAVGLTLNYTSYYNSSQFQNLTFATQGVGTATAITVHQTGTTTSVALEPITDFTNVTFRGADGYVLSEYWSTCFVSNNVSSVNFTNCLFSGPHPVGAGAFTLIGTGLQIGATSGDAPVQFGVCNCMFNYVGVGIEYGNLAQGVIVVNSNFTGGNYGIFVDPSIAGISELSVCNNQFNVAQAGIDVQSGCPNTNISNNTFFCNNVGVFLQPGALFTICGNSFGPSNGGVGTGIGLLVSAISGDFGGTVTGNTFADLSLGIWFQNAVLTLTTVTGNFFFGNTDAVLNTGLLNQFSNNVGLNPAGTTSPTPGSSPWTFVSGAWPGTLYLSATTGISSITNGGVQVLPVAIGANTAFSLNFAPNDVYIITYTGTLTVHQTLH